MQKMTIPRTRQRGTMIIVFLVGVLIAALLGLRLVLIVLWHSQLRLYGINRFVKLVNVQQSSGGPTAWTEQRREPQPQYT